MRRIPSRTYRFDFELKRIFGHIDGYGAVVQAIKKIFETERFAYPIYTANYGIELATLFGQDKKFVMAILEKRISQALFADDRITSIEDFSVEELTSLDPYQRDALVVSCTVYTSEGTVNVREEIKI
jgi:hypothetical protein